LNFELDDLRSFRDISNMPVYARKGFDRSLPPDRFLASPVLPNKNGIPGLDVNPSRGEGPLLRINELERIEILLDDQAFTADAARRNAERAGLSAPASSSGSRWEGYLIVGDELRPLPIGSTLDPIVGIFSWLPGPGFLGDYRLVFVSREGRSYAHLTIRIL
jgi:hypothetical protein